jgi:hypothetical protein
MKRYIKKSLYLLLPILLLPLGFTTPHPKLTYDWVYLLPGYYDVDFSDMVVDKSGSIFISANYGGKLSIPGLNKTLRSNSHITAMFMKLDKNGKAIWAHPITSANICLIYAMALAPNGDIVITGSCDGITSFPSPGDTLKLGLAKDKNDFYAPAFNFIARYSASGVRKWAHVYHTIGAGQGVAVNSKNEIYWSVFHGGYHLPDGQILDSLSFKKENYEKSVEVLKLDSNGKIMKILPIGYSSSTSAFAVPSLKIDRKDNLVICGFFSKKIEFTPKDSLTNDGYTEGTDSYVAKYDAADKFMWARKLGGQNYQMILDCAIDTAGNIYAAGRYSFECVISSGFKVVQKSKYQWKSGDSFFYCMFTPDGSLGFSKFYQQKGYNSYAEAWTIALDANGYVYIGGTFSDTLNFGTNIKPIISNGWNNGTMTEFSSIWDGSKLISLQKDIEANKGWSYPNRIRISGDELVIGGQYYGGNEATTTNGETVTFTKSTVGRATYIMKAKLPKLPKRTNITTDNLADIQPLMKCFAPGKEPDSNIWIPVKANDSLAAGKVQTNSGECGVKLDSCDAILFPNPTPQITTLRLKGISGQCRIDIISASGQVVFSQEIDDVQKVQDTEIDMGNAVSGVYFVCITQASYKKVLRLVKMN